MTSLPLWRDCTRCARHEQRLAVFAPAWPSTARVVVLGLAASRAAQAAQGHEPQLLRVVELLRQQLGLGADECVADHLLACGLGRHVVADQVAACGTRFVEQVADRGAQPDVVVLLGREAHSLAVESGLVDKRTEPWMWAPIGAGHRCPVLLNDDPSNVVAEVGAVLGIPVARSRRPARSQLAARATDLLAVLGKHQGHRKRQLELSDWRTRKGPISARLLALHLKGCLWVAPHGTAADWPYVVLDIDRHNALQEAKFNETLRKVRRHFPNSLLVESSSSGGVHVYVRLPRGTFYPTAARWMRAYLTLRGLRWARIKGEDGKIIQAELVEVPEQPPRLPFGAGSTLLGSIKPLMAQFDELLAFLTAPASRDYSRAKNHAVRMLRREGLEFGGRWTPARRRKLNGWLLDRELDLGSRHPKYPQSPSDPWLTPSLSDLPVHLRHVALAGIPAYGTRVRWTYALVDALVDRVPEAEVRALMTCWLKTRPHASEDVAADIDYAVQETDAIITGTYRRRRGVPARFWAPIEGDLRRFWTALFRPPSASGLVPPPWVHDQLRAPQRLDFNDVRKTAFFIARGFYAQGQQERAIFAEEFERFTGSNTAHDVQQILTMGGSWLHYEEAPVIGITARRFKITLWPRRRGEPSLLTPP